MKGKQEKTRSTDGIGKDENEKMSPAIERLCRMLNKLNWDWNLEFFFSIPKKIRIYIIGNEVWSTWKLLVVVIVCFSGSVIAYLFIVQEVFRKIESPGEFGDTFGFINALVAALGIAFVVRQLMMQIEDRQKHDALTHYEKAFDYLQTCENIYVDKIQRCNESDPEDLHRMRVFQAKLSQVQKAIININNGENVTIEEMAKKLSVRDDGKRVVNGWFDDFRVIIFQAENELSRLQRNVNSCGTKDELSKLSDTILSWKNLIEKLSFELQNPNSSSTPLPRICQKMEDLAKEISHPSASYNNRYIYQKLHSIKVPLKKFIEERKSVQIKFHKIDF